ncbi:unnamed protein product [Ceratitis capitata]|uniref:(Mediterranean fruit fly) hypothetical protein n=1 Tax=Ceratitis capitata TaxID=7213 RepID=A0A811UFY0_CERCA|nr:unnamed protein product [Ceratitis capitata]
MMNIVEDSVTGTKENLTNERWKLWCRLCAKQDADNINIFFKDEHMVGANKIMKEDEQCLDIAISKYFYVQIVQDAELPERICTDCFSLVTSMVNFNEHVAKVQQMFTALKCMSKLEETDYQTLRLRYGVFAEEGPHEFIFRPLKDIFLNEEKPNTNDCEEKCYVEEAVVNILPKASYSVIDVKEENSVDLAIPIDEDAYEFDSREVGGEDPFGSDNEKHIENSNVLNSFESRKTNSSEQNKKTIDKSGADSSEMYTCSECKQTFKRISCYRTHMERKHDQFIAVPKFICSECSFSCNTQLQLNQHAVKHLPLTKRRVVPCPHCEQKFPTKSYVAQHIKYVHMNERSFICEECGEAVRSKSQLKEHMLTHTDYAPFECEVCKKGFKNQVRLKNHMETHNPNKHICAECGLQLNSRATLNRHLLVHSDVMQHKCDFCGRAFKRAKALKNHLILHTGLKPYSCDFCDRTFANGSNCRTHKRKAHPEALAALEASGEKTYTKNIPKLAVLKSVTRAAENLAPVVSKQSGNFAFGKKPKLSPDSLGTVSKKQAKIYKESLSSLPIVNEPNGASNDIVCQPLLSDSQKHSQCTNSDSNTESRSIPTIDNIYNHLVKQTATNNQYNISTENGISSLPLDIKRAGREELSPSIAKQRNQFSAQLLSPSQHSVIPNDVPSFCTQFIKQTENPQQHLQPSALHQVHDKEASTNSPENHVSHLTEDQSSSTADSNHFYNQMRRHTPNTYL